MVEAAAVAVAAVEAAAVVEAAVEAAAVAVAVVQNFLAFRILYRKKRLAVMWLRRKRSGCPAPDF